MKHWSCDLLVQVAYFLVDFLFTKHNDLLIQRNDVKNSHNTNFLGFSALTVTKRLMQRYYEITQDK